MTNLKEAYNWLLSNQTLNKFKIYQLLQTLGDRFWKATFFFIMPE